VYGPARASRWGLICRQRVAPPGRHAKWSVEPGQRQVDGR
jgi:hypothetical protein